MPSKPKGTRVRRRKSCGQDAQAAMVGPAMFRSSSAFGGLARIGRLIDAWLADGANEANSFASCTGTISAAPRRWLSVIPNGLAGQNSILVCDG